MLPSTGTLLLLCSFLQAAAGRATRLLPRDGESPSLPYDPNTTKYCNWWLDLTEATTCANILKDNYITIEDFRRWNPSITADCGNLAVGKSFCVSTINEPAIPVVSTSASRTTSPTPATSSTRISSSSNLYTSTAPSATPIPTKPSSSPSPTTSPSGITTPQPTQPDMVSNCAKFYFVARGTTCAQVLATNQVSLADFYAWNPSVLSDCTGMWAEVNVCVGISGGSTTKPTSPTLTPSATPKASPSTTTTPGNGITTPLPTQPNMVTNCARFHFVARGETCAQVLAAENIALADLFRYNPSVLADCTGMWAEVNVCVGLIGSTSKPTPTPTPTPTPKPSPTSAGNGIATPTPTQPGMVGNCRKFHYVSEGDTCAQILSYEKITVADLFRWNSGVKADCTGMWAKVYVCVGV